MQKDLHQYIEGQGNLQGKGRSNRLLKSFSTRKNILKQHTPEYNLNLSFCMTNLILKVHLWNTNSEIVTHRMNLQAWFVSPMDKKG